VLKGAASFLKACSPIENSFLGNKLSQFRSAPKGMACLIVYANLLSAKFLVSHHRKKRRTTVKIKIIRPMLVLVAGLGRGSVGRRE